MAEGSSAEEIRNERIRTEDVITKETQAVDFSQLFISPAIVKGLKEAGYTHPTPIQLRAIPVGKLGTDLIVHSKAGTGKTLIFAVITLETIDPSSALPQALMLSATREIAIQIASVVQQVGKHIDGLQCHHFIGGTSKQDDRTKLRKCQVVVGTAGRMKDLVCDSALMHVSKVKLLVLDEVDALVGGDTLANINSIFRALPDRKQVCTFSATYTPSLIEVLQTYMRTPRFVSMEDTRVSLRGVREYYKVVKQSDAYPAKISEALRILETLPFTQCIIFCNNFDAAQKLTSSLCEKGMPAEYISAKLDQPDRNAIIECFSSFNVRILVSSDLTSRGIDMTKANVIINLDVPAASETYMHRIGRTGRFGSLGLAVSILTPAELEKIVELRKGVEADNVFEELPDSVSVDYMQGVLQSETDLSKFDDFEAKRKEGKPVEISNRMRRLRRREQRRRAREEEEEEEEEQGEVRPPSPKKKTKGAGSAAATPPPKAQAPWHIAGGAHGLVDTPATEAPPQQPFAAPATADYTALCQYYARYYQSYYSTAFDCIMQALNIPITLPPAPY